MIENFEVGSDAVEMKAREEGPLTAWRAAVTQESRMSRQIPLDAAQ